MAKTTHRSDDAPTYRPYKRRRSDQFTFIQRNAAILMWVVGGFIVGLFTVAHIEQHVSDLQNQIDRLESRMEYYFGKH